MDTSLNRPNLVLVIKGNHDQGNNGNQARDSAFDIGTTEAQQDPNVMMSTFSFIDHLLPEERKKDSLTARYWFEIRGEKVGFKFIWMGETNV
ncbi:hypothetical protein Tco_1578331 [Tanacetum coccineum]